MNQAVSWIEKIWYQKSQGYWLLLPLSYVFAAVSALRRGLFRLGLKQQHKLRVPVVVVGNITVGGTGKTPFTLWLCELLCQQGWKPGIISRGYGANIRQPVLVTDGANAADVGDEPLLLAQRSGCPVVVCPDRVAAAEYLLAQTGCDIIVSDDGLQHYRLARDTEIILIDGKRGLGNGQLLPAGPLREGRWRLRLADVVIANSQATTLADGVMSLIASAATALIGDDTLPACTVTLVAGIGNPERFADTAQAAGFHISARRYFADHHQFCADDFAGIDGPVLMTEKDAVKCRPFAKANWFSLAVKAELDAQLTTKITTILTNLRSSYGA